MEQLIETVALDSEEVNELMFKIRVEGTATGPAKVRLVVESTDMSYMFPAKPGGEDGVVLFTVPQMSGRLPEGTYPSKVEVLIENRVFVPVEFNTEFKKATKVVAESVSVVSRVSKPEVRVSAVPVVVSKKTTSEPRPIVLETPKVVSPPAAPTEPAPRTYAVEAADKTARQAVSPPKPKAPPPSTSLREAWEKKMREEKVDVREIARRLVPKK